MESCIYEGWVRHRRFEPCEHVFQYRMYMMYLDLGELPTLFDRFLLWSSHRPAVAWFRRSEHLGDATEPLDASVRNLVKQKTGADLTGPIRLLTNLRQFGFQMNPVSYFYCFDPSGTHVEAVVAEVNNTPWGEQHCYVIPRPQHANTNASRKVSNRKLFHVSPFMPMNMNYEWHLSMPGNTLNVHIRNKWQTAQAVEATAPNRRAPFDVTMSVSRTEITRWSMASILLRQPLITGKVFAAIYWQALRLWWKGVAFVPHPNKVVDPANSRTTQAREHTIPSQSSDQAKF